MSFLVIAKGNILDLKSVLLIQSLIKQILKGYYEPANILGMSYYSVLNYGAVLQLFLNAARAVTCVYTTMVQCGECVPNIAQRALVVLRMAKINQHGFQEQ